MVTENIIRAQDVFATKLIFIPLKSPQFPA
jgi:hypothetical protein